MIKIIEKIFNNKFGSILISVILGIGLASLFRKACKDRNCLHFKGPSISKIKNNIFKSEDGCVQFNEISVSCGSRKKTIDFA